MKHTYRGLGLMLSLIFSMALVYAQPPKSFSAAKRHARIVFASMRTTLYCRCPFDARLQVNLAACGMQAAQGIKRAQRVEWEHMMPAENFGRQFTCWREPLCVRKNGSRYKGRACCEKIDRQFRQAEAELYNLWPAVGLVNQARSNYRYSSVRPPSLFYGCAFSIDKAHRQVEPADWAKGIVARANLFMADTYQISLSAAQRNLFTAWNKQFPPTMAEKQWAQKVAAIEGYANPYIH